MKTILFYLLIVLINTKLALQYELKIGSIKPIGGTYYHTSKTHLNMSTVQRNL